MKDTNHTGTVTVAMVIAALVRNGKRVMIPFNDGLEYDLLVEESPIFTRVQCKTGMLQKGVVLFRNYSVLRSGGRRYYEDSVDAYGVYCPQNGSVYFIPRSMCCKNTTTLRIDPPKNNWKDKQFRIATNFLLG